MPLTNTAISKAKPTDKPQRLFDGGGMYLKIAPTGGRRLHNICGRVFRYAVGKCLATRDPSRDIELKDILPPEGGLEALRKIDEALGG